MEPGPSPDGEAAPRGLLAVLDRVGRLLEDVALTVLLGGLVLLASAQILLRNVFDTGFVWTGELLKLMVLWLAMLGAVAASRDDEHIRIDVISRYLPDRWRAGTRAVADLFTAAVCALIAWYAYEYVLLIAEFEETVLIDTPAWIVQSVLPFSLAVLAYRYLLLAVKHSIEAVRG